MTDILSIYFETITIDNNLGISGKQRGCQGPNGYISRTHSWNGPVSNYQTSFRTKHTLSLVWPC